MKNEEKPIIFNFEMVNAILNGEKTMTRRIVKPQPKGNIVFRNDLMKRCPYKIGTKLWVRETFTTGTHIGHALWIRYKATDEADIPKSTKWTPSIFMPRELSRINLEIINIRAEKLQDITEADAFLEGCEGIECLDCDANILAHINEELCWNLRPVEQFKNLWDSLNQDRDYSWSENPWIFCYKFRRVR